MSKSQSVGLMRLAQRADKHLSDHIGEIATWPKWARQLALAPLLDKRARFTLTTFLLGNRVPPIVIAEFMVTMLRDYSACLDVATMLDKYRRGNIHPSVNYWDMDFMTNMPLGWAPATVCLDEFWQPARFLLLKRGKALQRPRLSNTCFVSASAILVAQTQSLTEVARESFAWKRPSRPSHLH